MNVTNAIKKQKAIELMNKLDIYKPYIKGFKDKNSVCFYENFGGFWAYQEPELMAKIKEFEEKHNVLVYAVTHEYLEFGECYDFLYIPDYEEEWDEMLYPQVICFTPTLTYGTNPMTFALNSVQSVFARSAVELKELHEVRYDENNH